MNEVAPTLMPLLAKVRQLIDAARQRVASTVNAELTQLYWQIGRRISDELLQGQRGGYGKQVVAELARQLTSEFGRGWSEQQLRQCLRLAEVFADEHILSTVQRELSWSHLNPRPRQSTNGMSLLIGASALYGGSVLVTAKTANSPSP